MHGTLISSNVGKYALPYSSREDDHLTQNARGIKGCNRAAGAAKPMGPSSGEVRRGRGSG